jgi:hypothetical protein
VRRELEAEKKRLGLSEREWMAYIREKNAEFEARVRSGLKSAKSSASGRLPHRPH